jgi:hypothetical protein
MAIHTCLVTYIYLVTYICPTKFSDVGFCPTKFKLCPTKIKSDRINILSSQIFICSPGFVLCSDQYLYIQGLIAGSGHSILEAKSVDNFLKTLVISFKYCSLLMREQAISTSRKQTFRYLATKTE